VNYREITRETREDVFESLEKENVLLKSRLKDLEQQLLDKKDIIDKKFEHEKHIIRCTLIQKGVSRDLPIMPIMPINAYPTYPGSEIW
jgi:hypothetical protein